MEASTLSEIDVTTMTISASSNCTESPSFLDPFPSFTTAEQATTDSGVIEPSTENKRATEIIDITGIESTPLEDDD
jgi:hypothetical protein